MPATCPSLAQARKLTARCKNPKVPWSLFNGGRARAEALYGRCVTLAKRATAEAERGDCEAAADDLDDARIAARNAKRARKGQ